MSVLSLEIKRLRKAAGLSQEKLAEAMGLTQGAITHLETGRTDTVNAETLYALSDALGVGCDHWRPFLAKEASADVRTPDETRKKPKKKAK